MKNMALQDIVVPQMGEGLQEVSVVAFHKQPGDLVRRDETLYSMETDKAVVDVESPLEGTLKEWLASTGDTLPIGAPIARIETASSPEKENDKPVKEASSPGEVQIPPRTRAHCKELGISEEEMRHIPAPSGKLMPADVDTYLAAQKGKPEESDHTLRPLSSQQRTLIRHMRTSLSSVIPSTMTRPVRWKPIARLVEARRKDQVEIRPTEFQMLAYCVAQAAKQHPKFRSTLQDDTTAQEYAHLNLGIAVARENDDLLTAVVPQADTLDYAAFLKAAREHIHLAREGHDQADAQTQLILTYMGSYGVIDATPVLVAPAIAILFIGATYELNGETLANLSLTFDHRLINGVEAARFVNAIVELAEHIESAIP
jgi:pyruvate dehydrogenase E2 component (dihydrolipoamide acetyltransferase)